MNSDEHSFFPAPRARLATTTGTAASIFTLAKALRASSLVPIPVSRAGELDGIIGWGLKPSSRHASAAARSLGVRFWTAEDGFLRSVGLGKANAPALSFVLDDLGVYYDAATPTRLEHLIAGCGLTPAQLQRAGQFLDFLRTNRLSKYNSPEIAPVFHRNKSGRRILLVDQTRGDLSIAGSLASTQAFHEMIQTAIHENLGADLLLKTHPDVAAGFSAGASGSTRHSPQLTLVTAEGCPHSILDTVDEVWTVSSQLGFEALLRGIPVTTFGVPFYAGWGLTRDRALGEAALKALRRRAGPPRSLLDLVYCALIAYPVYLDPFSLEPVPAEQAAERLVHWRDEARRIGKNHICVGFSRWKLPHARTYLSAGGGVQKFITEARALRVVKTGDHVIVWGMKSDDHFARIIRERGARFSRIEDGFIRSFGLGSNFLFPWSLCLDDSGIYYDARQPSDLENLINSGPPPQEFVERAKRLRQALVHLGITKYNLPGAPPGNLRDLAAGRTIVLILGQVPDDFSIKLGRPTVHSNLDFLAQVRAENPKAFVVYKEHPEVVSGNRHGRTDLAELQSLADIVLQSGDVASWINACDHIHVMTSLAGFEALLRGKQVTCWGEPFYAGWGLTIDKTATIRRKCKPTLDELAAHVLVHYCIYRFEGVNVPASPEDILGRMVKIGTGKQTSGSNNGARHLYNRAYRYITAQIAAAFWRSRATQLLPASGDRWPFFRETPESTEGDRL